MPKTDCASPSEIFQGCLLCQIFQPCFAPAIAHPTAAGYSSNSNALRGTKDTGTNHLNHRPKPHKFKKPSKDIKNHSPRKDPNRTILYKNLKTTLNTLSFPVAPSSPPRTLSCIWSSYQTLLPHLHPPGAIRTRTQVRNRHQKLIPHL